MSHNFQKSVLYLYIYKDNFTRACVRLALALLRHARTTDFPDFNSPDFGFPDFDFPDFDFPGFDFPDFDFPDFGFPDFGFPD